MRTLTVVTHAGKFHADEIFAVAILSLLFEKKKWKMKLIRTLDPLWFKKADFVLDVGRVYNAKKNRFDHHQAKTAGKRTNGILYATFGLIWKHFGKELVSTNKVANLIDEKLITPLDAADVGISSYKTLYEGVRPVTLDEYIETEYMFVTNSGINLEKSDVHKYLDQKFNFLMEFAKEVIRVYIDRMENRVRNETKAKKIYQKAKDKRLIVLDDYLGFNFSIYKEPLIVVFPDLRGRWSAKTVRINDDGFKDRIYFPKKWRGKVDEDLAKVSGVPDAVFCHNSGFLAVADSKEGTIALAKIAIKTNTKS